MGEDFSLQKMDSETWKDIPLSLSYADNLIVISPNESHTFHYDIGSAVVLESNKTYQIVKVVSAGQTNHSVFASFEINSFITSINLSLEMFTNNFLISSSVK